MCQTASDAFDCTDLVALLRMRAVTSERQGYIFEERAGQTSLTFADLDRRARAVAKHLQATYPQAKSCLLCYPPGVDFLVGFFGSLYAGLTAVPAYPPRARRADSRLEAIAGDSPNAIVLTNQDILQAKERLAVQTLRLGALPWVETCTATDPFSWEPGSFPTDRPVVLQYTSGSTALPKGVMLTHGCILHNVRRMREILGLGPDTPGICWLPAFHDMGLIGNLLQTVYSGSNTYHPLAGSSRPGSTVLATNDHQIPRLRERRPRFYFPTLPRSNKTCGACRTGSHQLACRLCRCGACVRSRARPIHGSLRSLWVSSGDILPDIRLGRRHFDDFRRRPDAVPDCPRLPGKFAGYSEADP